MAITRLLPPKLIAIADAIRNKTGETELMTLEYMPEKINDIKGDDTLYQLLTDTLETYSTDKDIVWGDRGRSNSTNISLFERAQNLKYIYMPNATKTIMANYMFAYMTGLEEIYAPKLDVYDFNNPQGYNQLFYGDTNLRKVVLNGVSIRNGGATASYSQTFYNCSSLEYVEFTGTTLAKFNTNSLFNNCTNIIAFVLRNITELPSANTGFIGNYNPIADRTGAIYVPDNLVRRAQASSPWNTYNIRSINDLPDDF